MSGRPGGGGFWWRLVMVTAVVAATSCATRAHAQALIVGDACAPGYCNNSLVGSYPALKILYRTTTATEAEFATDLPNLARFAETERVSLVLERAAPESVRITFLPLLESSLGPDVMQWQGIQVMQPSLYNLDAEAAAGNWSQLFSAQLLATVTAADGSLYGVPTLQRSWGLWHKKTTLADVGVAAFPVGWDDFLALLATLNATAPGRAPLCISYGDGWQAQTWVSFLIGRVGGNTAWQRLLAMESDISADADVIEAWRRVAQLLPFFQGGAAALTKTFGDTLVDYVEQRCALLLSYGITRSFPALLGAVNDDYTWATFPEANAALDASERGEFSGFLVWAVNANARMLDAALAFVRLQASREYQTQFVGSLDGDLPAMTALFPLITDPEVQRCAAQLLAARNLWNFVDVVQPTFALYEKPLTTAGFTGGLAPEQMPQQWELVRQQQVLVTAVAPTYALATPAGGGGVSGSVGSGGVANLLVLTSYTPNASIWYSVGVAGADGGSAAQYLYATPVALESGVVSEVSALTRRAGMRDSGVVTWQISVGAKLVAGQALDDTPDVPLYVLAVCLALGGMWATVILVEQLMPAHFLWRHDPTRALLVAAATVPGVLRSSNDRRLARNLVLGWLALTVCAVTVTQWAASLAAAAAIAVPQLALVPTFSAIQYRLRELLTALLVPILPVSLAFYVVSARSVAIAERLKHARADANVHAPAYGRAGGGGAVGGSSDENGSSLGSATVSRGRHDGFAGTTDRTPRRPENAIVGVKYAADTAVAGAASPARAVAAAPPAGAVVAAASAAIETATVRSGAAHAYSNRHVRTLVRYFHSVRRRCDRHVAGAALLLTLSIACETFLVLESLVLPCTIAYDSGHVVAALVVTWLWAVGGLLATFYYRAKALRPLAALPMAAATVCMNFIVMAGASFRFDPSAAATAAAAGSASSAAGRVPASTVVDISAAAAAVTVFALMAVNVNRLKLGRDDFDRKYQAAGEKNARLETEKEQYRAALLAAQLSLLLIRNPLLSPLLVEPAAAVACASGSPTTHYSGSGGGGSSPKAHYSGGTRDRKHNPVGSVNGGANGGGDSDDDDDEGQTREPVMSIGSGTKPADAVPPRSHVSIRVAATTPTAATAATEGGERPRQKGGRGVPVTEAGRSNRKAERAFSATSTVTFEQVLDNPAAFDILRRQAIEGKAPEACDFLAATKEFKRLDPSDAPAVRNVCDNILDTFIVADRASTVNFSDTLVASVLAFAKKAGGAAQLLKTFDDCEAPARQLIRGNEWSTLSARPDKMRACAVAVALGAQLQTADTRQMQVDAVENAANLWARLHGERLAAPVALGGATTVVAAATTAAGATGTAIPGPRLAVHLAPAQLSTVVHLEADVHSQPY